MGLKEKPVKGMRSKDSCNYVETVLRDENRNKLEERLKDYVTNQGWEQMTAITYSGENEKSGGNIIFAPTDAWLKGVKKEVMSSCYFVVVRRKLEDGHTRKRFCSVW